MKQKVAVIMCNDMHMDIERSNVLLNYIAQNAEYEIVCDYTVADIIIIQTCAFGKGKKFSVQVITDVIINALETAKVIVTGCLLPINNEELKAIPRIEVKSFKEVISMFKKVEILSYKPIIPQNKVIISQGCLKKCSYCVYPLITGKYASKPMEQIMEEVKYLYETETNIYLTGAQETSDYGIDLYGKPSFAELLQGICEKFPNCNYIIGWFHPAGLTDKIISVIAQNKNIVEIMLHIQHANNKILKSMNRPTMENTDAKIQKLRELRPDLVISTEVIVGFPGEGEKEFQELVEYLGKGYFSDIGVASYDQVIGTTASVMENQISIEVKAQRLRLIQAKFDACIYPASNDFEMSIIEEYMKAYHLLNILPKNILRESQKYNCIAGVDTKIKIEGLEEILQDVLERIFNSRSEFDFNKNKKFFAETYTDAARNFFYHIIEGGLFKEKIKIRARKLLLE